MFLPLHRPTRAATPIELLSGQIAIARELGLSGAVAPARAVCASILFDHAPVLQTHRAWQEKFTECLLLLEMSSLLARFLRALYGVELVVSPIAGATPRRLLYTLDRDRCLAVPSPGLRANAALRQVIVAEWSPLLLDAAAELRDGEHVVLDLLDLDEVLLT